MTLPERFRREVKMETASAIAELADAGHIAAYRPDEDWPPTTPGVIDGACARCGLDRPVVTRVDPYTDELYPEDENRPSNWCRPCWEARKDDV